MSKSIPLSKKYGLNPTLCTCFYCGEETGEIALLGDNYKGEAPHHMCTGIEPCPACKEKYKDYVLLVETKPDEKNTPQPTGRWIAMEKNCVNVQNDGVCIISEETYNFFQAVQTKTGESNE